MKLKARRSTAYLVLAQWPLVSGLADRLLFVPASPCTLGVAGIHITHNHTLVFAQRSKRRPGRSL